ncbi:SDR family NAD(P)-dependent oxidoreductase [Micrococcus luteus]|uniref:SDR family NAD(P)-dependent oxidoreductase n=1 Tax=Micrococcus luteus TaxID=1270 RepID=UPI000953D974|nr:3-oxoacyl-[acyl-carrier protein] reductase [Virgibacillus pantothenticus]
MENLTGKIAIVTGVSYSKAIGAATCLSLAKAGADIFFTHWSPFDETEGRLERDFPNKLCEKINSFRVRSDHIQLDLSIEESPNTLLNAVQESLGTANILVNNATYEAPTNFRTLTSEILDKHYQVNNRGTLIIG